MVDPPQQLRHRGHPGDTQHAGRETVAKVLPALRQAHRRQRATHPVHDGRRTGCIGIGEYHQELLAAIAPDGIRTANRGQCVIDEFAQHQVTGFMTMAVIDALEVIQVDQAQRITAPLGRQLPGHVFEQGQDAAPVERAGQFIGLCDAQRDIAVHPHRALASSLLDRGDVRGHAQHPALVVQAFGHPQPTPAAHVCLETPEPAFPATGKGAIEPGAHVLGLDMRALADAGGMAHQFPPCRRMPRLHTELLAERGVGILQHVLRIEQRDQRLAIAQQVEQFPAACLLFIAFHRAPPVQAES